MKRPVDINIKPDKLILKNNATGEDKEFIIRLFKRGDEEGIRQCVRDEYGDSYFKKGFYDLSEITAMAEGDHYDFFVAEADGRVAGLEIFAYFLPEETCVEPASQILSHEYRNYGLSKAMVEYTFDIIHKMEPSSIFVHAVTFHIFTQKLCESMGMIPTGFRIGRFLTRLMENSYPKGRCEKYSEGVMIRPEAKNDAGTVWIPEELKDFAKMIYDRLGVKYEIKTDADAANDEIKTDADADCSGQAAKEDAANPCRLAVKADETQEFIEIRVDEYGAGLREKVEEIIERYRGIGAWSIQVILSDSTPEVIRAYYELKEAGLFFTGLKPLCADHEQLYMQWVDDWELAMEDYVLTDRFSEIRDCIERKRKPL